MAFIKVKLYFETEKTTETALINIDHVERFSFDGDNVFIIYSDYKGGATQYVMVPSTPGVPAKKELADLLRKHNLIFE